jgi:UDP-N-acetylglucosamine:LPS N-acetylglucosamine transferase
MKILFIISDTGVGHRAVAEAIVEELRYQLRGRFEYKIVDLLKLSKIPLVQNFSEIHSKMSQGGIWLWLYNLYFKLTNSPLVLRIFTFPFQIFIRSRIKILDKLFIEEKPDIVININAFTNVLIQFGKFIRRFRYKYIDIVSDITTIHYGWVVGEHDICIVPTQEAYNEVNHYRIKNLRVMGYPIKRKFLSVKSMLYKESDSLRILLFGRNTAKTISSIESLLHSFKYLKLTVICGRNYNLKKELERRFRNVNVLGFVNNVHEIMAKNNVVITKAGPGVIMEAIFLQKPIVITHYIGIHERKNIDFVVENGYGYYCPDSQSLIRTIRELGGMKYSKSSNRFHYEYRTGEIVKEIVKQ